MKTIFQKVVCLLMILALCACTSQLWHDTDPRERFWICAADISEAELRHRGATYERYFKGPLDGYLVEKCGVEKFKDYTCRVLGTPVTLVVDAVGYVVIIGVYTLAYNPELLVELLIEACD